MARNLAIALMLAAGPALASDAARTPFASILPPRTDAPLVWVLDGAGDLRGCSKALASANTLAGNLTEVAVFPWSHGYGRLLMDQVRMTHARTQGAKLAAAILDRQKAEPGRRVVLVAHSAGCAVALAAGDSLPPDSVDRVILLAPSVSTGYDIRPTLRAAREGVDVFCSKKDWLALGFVTRVVGTTDKFLAPAAGRHGFRMTTPDTEGMRLRQHFWSAELSWTGHTGGHYGVHAPAFIHAYLFPAFGVRAPTDGPRVAPAMTVRTEYRPFVGR